MKRFLANAALVFSSFLSFNANAQQTTAYGHQKERLQDMVSRHLLDSVQEGTQTVRSGLKMDMFSNKLVLTVKCSSTSGQRNTGQSKSTLDCFAYFKGDDRNRNNELDKKEVEYGEILYKARDTSRAPFLREFIFEKTKDACYTLYPAITEKEQASSSNPYFTTLETIKGNALGHFKNLDALFDYIGRNDRSLPKNAKPDPSRP